MDGDKAFDEMLARLRGLSQFAKNVAAEAAPLAQEAVRKTADAGQDPESGKEWQKRRDGSRALAKASSAVTAIAKGAVLQIILAGSYVWHQRAKGKTSMPQRRIIPDGGAGVPQNIRDAVVKAAERVFARTTGGR